MQQIWNEQMRFSVTGTINDAAYEESGQPMVGCLLMASWAPIAPAGAVSEGLIVCLRLRVSGDEATFGAEDRVLFERRLAYALSTCGAPWQPRPDRPGEFMSLIVCKSLQDAYRLVVSVEQRLREAMRVAADFSVAGVWPWYDDLLEKTSAEGQVQA